MKQNIHPKWFPEARVVCQACGTTWTTGATRQTLSVDVCANCHPFYTGEQRIVDTEGRVDRFMKRLETRNTIADSAAKAASGIADLPLTELGLGVQYTQLLANNGVTTANDFITRLKEMGDDGLLAIRGVGRKLITDIKKKLRARGFELPTLAE